MGGVNYLLSSAVANRPTCIVSNLKRVFDCHVIRMINSLPGTTGSANLQYKLNAYVEEAYKVGGPAFGCLC